MTHTIMNVFDAALALPQAEREELALLLTMSIGPDTHTPNLAWDAEIRRRIAEVESGEVTPIPFEEVQRQIDAMLDADDDAHG